MVLDYPNLLRLSFVDPRPLVIRVLDWEGAADPAVGQPVDLVDHDDPTDVGVTDSLVNRRPNPNPGQKRRVAGLSSCVGNGLVHGCAGATWCAR